MPAPGHEQKGRRPCANSLLYRHSWVLKRWRSYYRGYLMPRIALFVVAIVFAALAAICAGFFVLDIDIVFGNSLFRPLNIVAAAIFFMLLAGWMLIASLEIRSDG